LERKLEYSRDAQKREMLRKDSGEKRLTEEGKSSFCVMRKKKKRRVFF